MASEKASHVTGSSGGDDGLRRRNLDSHKDPNGTISVSQVEIDDKKSKKVRKDFIHCTASQIRCNLC